MTENFENSSSHSPQSPQRLGFRAPCRYKNLRTLKCLLADSIVFVYQWGTFFCVIQISFRLLIPNIIVLENNSKERSRTCSYRQWRRHFLLPAADTEDQLQFKGNYPSLHKLKKRLGLDSIHTTQWLTVLIIAEDQGSVPTIHVAADNHLVYNER